MKRSLYPLLLLVLPIGQQPTSIDSSQTTLEIIGSIGQFANISRGCEGNISGKEKVPIEEVGLSIDHKFTAPIRIGVRGSYFTAENTKDFYDQDTGSFSEHTVSSEILSLNPFFAIEGQRIAVGMGALWTDLSLTDSRIEHDLMPSVMLRLGSLQEQYFTISVLHPSPLLSEGFLSVGTGSQRHRHFQWWIGAGIGPYDKFGISSKSSIKLHQGLSMSLFGRFGGSEGIRESVVGVGLRYRY